MAALRCSDCSIKYPFRRVRICDVCGEKLRPIANAEPDENWEELVEEAKEDLAEANREVSPIPSFNIPIQERDGFMFVSSIDICNQRYNSRLQPDMLVEFNGDLYEIGGYSYERREYWVILVEKIERGTALVKADI